MATKTKPKATGYATEMRRCTGSARFGIEAHEAPVSTFPKQPSRPDGLGVMCAEHWKAYVKGLTADRKARAVSGETSASAKEARARANVRAVARGLEREQAAKATTKRRRAVEHVPTARDLEVAQAKALVAEVDALPADQHVERVGQEDVQAALEVIGNANGHRQAPEPEEPESPETPLGETLDGGTEESDAA